MGGFAARVAADLQELVEIDGDADAGDAAGLDVRPADDGKGSTSRGRGVAACTGTARACP
jgi:hypothetical protein